MGYSSTLQYVAAAAQAVLAHTGLLPHVNAGVMGQQELAQLRQVSVSQGLMLESVSERLMQPGGAHHACPDKVGACSSIMVLWASVQWARCRWAVCWTPHSLLGQHQAGLPGHKHQHVMHAHAGAGACRSQQRVWPPLQRQARRVCHSPAASSSALVRAGRSGCRHC